MKQSNCFRLFHIKGSDSSFQAAQSLKIQEAGWGHTTPFSTFGEIFSAIDHCTSFHRSTKPEAGKDDCSEAEGGKEIRNGKPVHLGPVCAGCWLLHPDWASALRAADVSR